MTTLDVLIAGEPLRLDARRALFWPRRRWLLVADLHLGKASLLRQAGIALPTGTTTGDLARLSALIEHHAPERLLVLGDLIHGPEPRDARWIDTFRHWLKRQDGLPILLVSGNHDRHMDLTGFGLDTTDALDAAPFRLRHAPEPDGEGHVIAGHVHPGAVLRDGRLRHRCPAFWLGPRRSLLPAFGSLSGLAPMPASGDDSVVAVTPGGLLRL